MLAHSSHFRQNRPLISKPATRGSAGDIGSPADNAESPDGDPPLRCPRQAGVPLQRSGQAGFLALGLAIVLVLVLQIGVIYLAKAQVGIKTAAKCGFVMLPRLVAIEDETQGIYDEKSGFDPFPFVRLDSQRRTPYRFPVEPEMRLPK